MHKQFTNLLSKLDHKGQSVCSNKRSDVLLIEFSSIVTAAIIKLCTNYVTNLIIRAPV